MQEEFDGFLVRSLVHDGQREVGLVPEAPHGLFGIALGRILYQAALYRFRDRLLVSDGAPVLFRQKRVGRTGGCSRCYKFRTMGPDAEEQLDDLHALNELHGPLFKIKDDPRVTRVGRVPAAHLARRAAAVLERAERAT